MHNICVAKSRNTKDAKEQCSMCPAKFVQNCSLRRHEREKHFDDIKETLKIRK